MEPTARTAEVCISRTSSNIEDDCITLTIRQPGRMIDIKLSLADFALALTGRGGIMGEYHERQFKRKKS